MAIDGTAGTLAGSQACAVFTAQPGGAGFNGLSFREKGGQARAVPRPCPERRETRPAERRRPGWAKGEDRPFLGGAKRIVPFVGIPEENTGHSREGGLERTRHLGSERQLELKDAVAEVIEIPAVNRR